MIRLLINIGITIVILLFLTIYMLYDIQCDIFCLNNGGSAAYMLYVCAKSCDRLSQWSNRHLQLHPCGAIFESEKTKPDQHMC